jgi:hypothetical protein
VRVRIRGQRCARSAFHEFGQDQVVGVAVAKLAPEDKIQRFLPRQRKIAIDVLIQRELALDREQSKAKEI